MRPRLPDKLRQPNLAGGFLDNLATNSPNLRAIESSVLLLQTGETYILSTQFFIKMYFDTLGMFSRLGSHMQNMQNFWPNMQNMQNEVGLILLEIF